MSSIPVPGVVRQANRPGDKLLLERGCTLCSSETGGVGAAATELLHMMDVLQSEGTPRAYLVSCFCPAQLFCRRPSMCTNLTEASYSTPWQRSTCFLFI